MSNVEIISPNLPEGRSDIFRSGCEVLTNPVNVVGVMGAGLARAFALRFPLMNEAYKEAYRRKELALGSLHVYKNPEIAKPAWKWIVNFPTMHFPGEMTRRETLEAGFEALATFVRDNNVKSIAIPALGGGIGRFPFEQLMSMVEEFAAQFPDLKVKLYRPQ